MAEIVSTFMCHYIVDNVTFLRVHSRTECLMQMGLEIIVLFFDNSEFYVMSF